MHTSKGMMTALIDSGAEANFIKKETARELNLNIKDVDPKLSIRVASGDLLKSDGRVDLQVDGNPVELFVAPISARLILSLGFLG